MLVVHLAQAESMSLLEWQMGAAEQHYYMLAVGSQHHPAQDKPPEPQMAVAEQHCYMPVVGFDHLLA
jgi:hypothetical protein